MKKFTIIVFVLLLVVSLTAAEQLIAATNDFIADADITVTGVTFGAGTADMLILNTSTAESWTFNSGAFTVTNPGTFKIGSSDSNIKSIKATRGGSDVACAENSTAGTSYLTLPNTAGTYTITPLTTTDCTTLCATVSNAATYNSFPTCGAATCNSGYSVSGSGANATCAAVSGGTVSTTYCSGAEYDEWQDACVNNLQYRNVLSRSPIGCTLTSSQESERTRECGITQAEDTAVETPEQETTTTQETASTAGMPETDSAGNITLAQMLTDAKTVASGDVNQVIDEMGVKRNLTDEAGYSRTIVEKVVAGSGITAQIRNTITNFVTYGTKATKTLGAGERAGVVNSFYAAIGRLPTSAEDWNDVIKIANGRWPSQTSAAAEDRASINFKKIYLRTPNRSNAHDDAAITVMAYGLRPANRNLDSEKAAIKIFKAIYGYNPENATAWDVVRAIAYSGATR